MNAFIFRATTVHDVTISREDMSVPVRMGGRDKTVTQVKIETFQLRGRQFYS